MIIAWTVLRAFATNNQRWPRLVGHEFGFVKWGFAEVELSMAPLAAPCAGQERAARWVTRTVTYAACSSACRCPLFCVIWKSINAAAYAHQNPIPRQRFLCIEPEWGARIRRPPAIAMTAPCPLPDARLHREPTLLNTGRDGSVPASCYSMRSARKDRKWSFAPRSTYRKKSWYRKRLY